MPRLSKTTTDHEFIRKWVEERKGWPARVKRTGGNGDPGIIRIDFPGYKGKESLEKIPWEEFFKKFEESKLAFLYQEKTSTGRKSNFNKLVSRDQPEPRTRSRIDGKNGSPAAHVEHRAPGRKIGTLQSPGILPLLAGMKIKARIIGQEGIDLFEDTAETRAFQVIDIKYPARSLYTIADAMRHKIR
jgi:hypothetical protein